MKRNMIFLQRRKKSNTLGMVFLLCFFAPLYFSGWASASYAPQRAAIAGAGRAGLISDPLFSNPAALSVLTYSSMFGYYTKTNIRDWDTGGGAWTLGAYDGENTYAHAGMSYSSENRERVVFGKRERASRKEIRLAFGRALSFLHAGILGKYVTRKTGAGTENFLNADLGVMFSLTEGLILGLTYEQLADRAGEDPPTINAGIHYLFAGPLQLFLDGGYITKGNLQKKKLWSAGMKLAFVQGLYLMGGYYKNPIEGRRGSSMGISWEGPRTSFDYALQLTKHAPVERSHTFGMRVQF